jgi:hypothetical protein
VEITKSNVAADEKLATATKSRERDEFQKEMDAEIAALVKGWLAAEDPQNKVKAEDRKPPEDGKATVTEGKRPKARYHVAPDDKSAFKDVLRRAATLHKVEAVFLYPLDADGHPTTREPVDAKTGKAAVTLTVGPRKATRTH